MKGRIIKNTFYLIFLNTLCLLFLKRGNFFFHFTLISLLTIIGYLAGEYADQYNRKSK